MNNIDLARLTAQQRIAEQNRHQNEAIDSTNFLAESQRFSLASDFAQHILSRVSNVISQLDESQEIEVNLVCGGMTTFSVSRIGYVDPSLIVFTGFTEEGKKVERFQHVSQTNCDLIVRPKRNLEQPERTIGFKV